MSVHDFSYERLQETIGAYAEGLLFLIDPGVGEGVFVYARNGF